MHGFPHVAVSIGLIYNKRPVVGVIYNPFLDQLFTGAKGLGSYLTLRGQTPHRLPLARPRPLPSLSQALIGIECGSDRSASIMHVKAEAYRKLAGNPAEGVEGGRMAHSLRALGTAALEFCMVAQGSLDIYWEIGCW